MNKITKDDKEKLIEKIEEFRKEKPLSVSRNDACDLAKAIMEGLVKGDK